MNNGEKRTLKGLILEMKLSENSEERIIAEETILNIFEQLEKEKAALIAVCKRQMASDKSTGAPFNEDMAEVLSKLGGGGNG